jgi:hypothetical protein
MRAMQQYFGSARTMVRVGGGNVKKLWFLPLVLLFAGCHNNVVTPPVVPPTNADHTVTLSWSQSEADSPVCSATVTTSCLSGYSEGTMSGATFTSLHTDTMAVCTGTAEPLSCTTTFQTAALPIGSVTFGLVLNYVDQNGAAQKLAAVTTASAIQVAADSPTALTATVQ